MLLTYPGPSSCSAVPVSCPQAYAPDAAVTGGAAAAAPFWNLVQQADPIVLSRPATGKSWFQAKPAFISAASYSGQPY